MQDHDRHLARCFLAILLKVGSLSNNHRPEVMTLLGSCLHGVNLLCFAADLNHRVGVAAQIVAPNWITWLSIVRSDHKQALAVAKVGLKLVLQRRFSM